MGEIWANCSGKKGPDHKRHWCKRDGMLSHPAAGLVVVEVHQLAGAVQSPGNFIGFSLADVDKVLSKSEKGDRGRLAAASKEYRYLEDCSSLVSVLDVVPAPAPDPRGLEVLRPVGAATAAARQLPVLTKYYVT